MGDRYLRNLAKSLMGQLGITVEDLAGEFPDCEAQYLYEHRSKEIKAQLRRMRPETLGRIAACGKGRTEEGETQQGPWLYHVHCGAYLDKYADGVSLLREIACTAIVAEMANILRLRKEFAAYAPPGV